MRILPVEEWPKLADTEAADIWAHLDSAKTRVLVEEEDGIIIACQVLTFVLHAECFWVHPAYRGRHRIARNLWAGAQNVARSLGAATIATAACDDRLARVLERMKAIELPGQHFVLAVKD